MQGRIHSIETLGALDGPGLRVVVFMQGCPLRCQYCHNPDTWAVDGGRDMDSCEILSKVERYRPYFGENGGLTLSGGEPFMQADFTGEILRLARESGIHTAVDTSGVIVNDKVAAALDYCDLLILDIKHTDDKKFRKLTGGNMANLLRFLALAEEKEIPLLVRQVIVPGHNDTPDDMAALAAMLSGYPALEKVELLAYHDMGRKKWDELGLNCPLADTVPPTTEKMAELDAILKKRLA